jgi:hypothetical protein
MFCIAAFIIFAVLGIFSVRYRTLAKKSWGCVLRKITFKPCDISVQEEIKSRLVGKFIFTKPRLARFINRWASTLAFIFVALSVWSLFSVFNSGLNLFVYDTCNPNNPESCALAGEGCGITSGKPGFWLSLKEGQVITWAKDDVLTFIETISRIPNRLKTWDALTASQTALRKLRTAVQQFPDDGTISESYQTLFKEMMNDDLNTASGLATIWELLKNSDVSDADKKATILDFDKVLGLDLTKQEIVEIPDTVVRLLAERSQARTDKNFARSDEIRNEIESLGFIVKDSGVEQIVTKK